MCGTITPGTVRVDAVAGRDSGVAPYLLLPSVAYSLATSSSHCVIAASSSLVPMFSVIAFTGRSSVTS